KPLQQILFVILTGDKRLKRVLGSDHPITRCTDHPIAKARAITREHELPSNPIELINPQPTSRLRLCRQKLSSGNPESICSSPRIPGRTRVLMVSSKPTTCRAQIGRASCRERVE